MSTYVIDANIIWKQIRFHNMPLSAGQKLLKHLKKLPLISALQIFNNLLEANQKTSYTK